MNSKFVVNDDVMNNFLESFKKHLKDRFGYDDELAHNISETAMNLASFYGMEYIQDICDAICSCTYTVVAEKGLFPEYKSSLNDKTGEVDRTISLPVNSDVNSPYAREYVLMPTIRLINSYRNEYTKTNGSITRRCGVMKENLQTKKRSGESLEREFEAYAHKKIVKEVIAPEENATIEPLNSNEKEPLSAFLLLDGSLGLDEITRESILTGDEEKLREKFDFIFGENTYDYIKNNSGQIEPKKILESYVEAVSEMQKETSKKIAA